MAAVSAPSCTMSAGWSSTCVIPFDDPEAFAAIDAALCALIG
jgi:hypothetical protein